MFRSFADVQTPESLDLPRPRLESGKAIVVACPMSDEQRGIQQKLVERYERLRSRKVDPRIDNALAITTDGRKLAIDARMLEPSASEHGRSKTNALADNIAAIWRRTAATRGTQMVFSDMGVHPTPWGYSVYDEVIAKLVARGVPREQIAAVGEADSDAKKQSLFEKVRNGSVRVLLGSTQKMGTGTNVQRRLAALHHLDAPWKPAEVEQREGRILRQGNENKEVAVYRYVTEGSFDAYMWQALETKARFIAQIMTGESGVRRAEDIGGQELSYAEVKAIASGNPAVLTLAEADAELQRLMLLNRNHLDEQYVARRNVRDLPQTIRNLSERLASLSADHATATACAGEPIVIADQSLALNEAATVLAGRLAELSWRVSDERRVPLGHYRGLRFGLILHPQYAPEVYLDGAASRTAMLSREHHGVRAVLNGLERLASGYADNCAHVRQDLAIAEAQFRDYEARLGKPFEHEAYLNELSILRDRLKMSLAGTRTQPDAETISAPEIAARIKALKAGHALEPTSHSGSNKRTNAAEEPVTARIRRRTESLAVAESNADTSTVAPESHQDRLAKRERSGGGREL
jgi:hypothetical protein